MPISKDLIDCLWRLTADKEAKWCGGNTRSGVVVGEKEEFWHLMEDGRRAIVGCGSLPEVYPQEWWPHSMMVAEGDVYFSVKGENCEVMVTRGGGMADEAIRGLLKFAEESVLKSVAKFEDALDRMLES